MYEYRIEVIQFDPPGLLTTGAPHCLHLRCASRGATSVCEAAPFTLELSSDRAYDRLQLCLRPASDPIPSSGEIDQWGAVAEMGGPCRRVGLRWVPLEAGSLRGRVRILWEIAGDEETEDVIPAVAVVAPAPVSAAATAASTPPPIASGGGPSSVEMVSSSAVSALAEKADVDAELKDGGTAAAAAQESLPTPPTPTKLGSTPGSSITTSYQATGEKVKSAEVRKEADVGRSVTAKDVPSVTLPEGVEFAPEEPEPVALESDESERQSVMDEEPEIFPAISGASQRHCGSPSFLDYYATSTRGVPFYDAFRFLHTAPPPSAMGEHSSADLAGHRSSMNSKLLAPPKGVFRWQRGSALQEIKEEHQQRKQHVADLAAAARERTAAPPGSARGPRPSLALTTRYGLSAQTSMSLTALDAVLNTKRKVVRYT